MCHFCILLNMWCEISHFTVTTGRRIFQWHHDDLSQNINFMQGDRCIMFYSRVLFMELFLGRSDM